jgi:hypothetical protein
MKVTPLATLPLERTRSRRHYFNSKLLPHGQNIGFVRRISYIGCQVVIWIGGRNRRSGRARTIEIGYTQDQIPAFLDLDSLSWNAWNTWPSWYFLDPHLSPLLALHGPFVNH